MLEKAIFLCLKPDIPTDCRQLVQIEIVTYSIKTRRNSFSTRFKNLSKTINPQKYHANDTQNTRLQLKNT